MRINGEESKHPSPVVWRATRSDTSAASGRGATYLLRVVAGRHGTLEDRIDVVTAFLMTGLCAGKDSTVSAMALGPIWTARRWTTRG